MSKKEKHDGSQQEEIDLNDQNITEQEVVEEGGEETLVNLQEEVQREKDRFLRLYAEFENYKKRTSRERIELFKTAGEGIILSLLPVLDDFGRALKEQEKSKDENHFKGTALIYNKLKETLKSKGLEEIEVNPGDAFDLEIHEAITQVPAPEKKLKGKIVDVVEMGYRMGDKIIRYPKVVIGQ